MDRPACRPHGIFCVARYADCRETDSASGISAEMLEHGAPSYWAFILRKHKDMVNIDKLLIDVTRLDVRIQTGKEHFGIRRRLQMAGGSNGAQSPSREHKSEKQSTRAAGEKKYNTKFRNW